jgi:hypothetical protein
MRGDKIERSQRFVVNHDHRVGHRTAHPQADGRRERRPRWRQGARLHEKHGKQQGADDLASCGRSDELGHCPRGSAAPGTRPQTCASMFKAIVLNHRRLPRISHSHSMVPGGLLVISRTTRLMPRISLMIRLEMRVKTS